MAATSAGLIAVEDIRPASGSTRATIAVGAFVELPESVAVAGGIVSAALALAGLLLGVFWLGADCSDVCGLADCGDVAVSVATVGLETTVCTVVCCASGLGRCSAAAFG